MAPDSLDDVSRPASGIPHRRQRARNQTAPVAPGAEPPVGRRTSGRPSKPYRRRRHRSGDAAVTRSELEHAIRAACDVSGDDELYVIGSQAILGQYPDAPDALRQSAEADVAPVHAIESRCDRCSARGVVIVPSGVRILRSWSVDRRRGSAPWMAETSDRCSQRQHTPQDWVVSRGSRSRGQQARGISRKGQRLRSSLDRRDPHHAGHAAAKVSSAPAPSASNGTPAECDRRLDPRRREGYRPPPIGRH